MQENRGRFTAGRGFYGELAAILLVVVASILCLWHINDSWQAPPDEFHVRHSVLWAAGYGNVDYVEIIPELEAFQNGELPALDLECIPKNLSFVPAQDRNHHYLIVLRGLFFRYLGVSYHTNNLLIVLFLGFSALLSYAFARIGMGRIAALCVACAYLLNPFLIDAFYARSLRDVSKVPFFLGTFIILALLLKSSPSPAKLIRSALVLGAVIGIGFGFRNDMNVLLPISIPVFLFCPGREIRKRVRILAITVLVITVVVFGSDVSSFSPETMRINLWRISCGFASRFDQKIVSFASYERSTLFDDRYGLLSAQNAWPDLRIPANFSIPLATVEEGVARLKAYVATIIAMFPADMLTRVYGATFFILQRLQARDDVHFVLHWIGPLCACFFFLRFLAMDWRKGALALYLLLSFCGYTTLQFDQRHMFHLYIVPLWFIGVTAHVAAIGLVVLFRSWTTPFPRLRLSTSLLPSARSAVAALAPILLTAAVLWLPLAGLRLYQDWRLRRLLDEYRNARSTPALAAVEKQHGRALYRVTPGTDCFSRERSPEEMYVHSDLYMLEMEFDGEMPDVRIEYESLDNWNHALSARLQPGAHPQRIRIFFPAYDFAACDAYAWFKGVSLPDHQAPRFRGLYRISRHALTLPSLVLVVPEDMNTFISRQRVRMPWQPSDYKPYYADNTVAFMLYIMKQTSPEDAIATLSAYLEQYPREAFARFALAVAHERQGNRSAAIHHALAAVDAYPDYETVLYGLCELLLWHMPDTGIEALNAIGSQRPWMHCLNAAIRQTKTKVSRACLQKGVSAWQDNKPEDAVAWLQRAAKYNPECVTSGNWLAAVYLHQGRTREAIDAYRGGVATEPLGNLIKEADLLIGRALPMLFDTFAQHAMTVEAPDPEPPPDCGSLPENCEKTADFTTIEAAHLDALVSACADAQGRLAFWHCMAKAHPEKSAYPFYFALAALERHAASHAWGANHILTVLATHIRGAGFPEWVIGIYRRALRLVPEDLNTSIGLAEALATQGYVREAVEEYVRVLTRVPESPGWAMNLDALLRRPNADQDRLQVWESIVKACPDAVTPRLHLGWAYEDAGEMEKAVAQYRLAYAVDPENALLLICLGGRLLADGDEETGTSMIERACILRPGYAGKAANAYAAAAKRLLDRGSPADAARYYEKAMTLDPTALWHRVYFAEALEALQQYDEAIKQYLEVLMRAPESPYTATRLDAVFVKHNQTEERIAAWQAVVQAHPEAIVPKRHLDNAVGKIEGP